MKLSACLLVLLITWLPQSASGTESTTTRVTVFGGIPFNLRSPFTLTQDQFPDLQFTASFKSEPFVTPVFYAIRVERVQSRWALEFMHHKLFLKNPPPEIQGFEITHGFNLITIQRGWTVSAIELRVGAGVVLAHPESTVRGQRYDDTRGILGTGYRIAGPVLMTGGGRSFRLAKRVFLTLEGRTTLAPVRVPVSRGDASLTHVAFHGLFGVGFSF